MCININNEIFFFSPSSSSPSLNSFYFRFNKDLCSLKCQERQMNKLVEIIRSSLNEASINELSSGCDDLSVEIDKNLGTDENIVSILIKYFKRT